VPDRSGGVIEFSLPIGWTLRLTYYATGGFDEELVAGGRATRMPIPPPHKRRSTDRGIVARITAQVAASSKADVPRTDEQLARPICAVVKGPSSTGKSFVTGQVLSLFFPSPFYRLSGMSEKALAYGKEPLVHRTLMIEETAGLTGGMGAYLLRSLISEGYLRCETVVPADPASHPAPSP
jgi:hypothetical protein